MKRVIKFRAQSLLGKTVYGDLYHGVDGVTIIDVEHNHIYVYPDSVCQLIGVDANGSAVYEDDKVKRIREWNDDKGKYIDVDNLPFKATFEDYAAIRDGEIVKVII